MDNEVMAADIEIVSRSVISDKDAMAFLLSESICGDMEAEPFG